MTRRPIYEWSKRAFDIVASSIALLVLSPLLAAIALAVLVDSGRPVFYCPTRTGRYGVPFGMIKFRTMVVNARSIGGLLTARNDPRVTRVGHVLRRSKLDELPQLLNILKGEMSIVGPRPEHPEYTALYTIEERVALDVPQGLTDPASIRYIRLGDLLGDDDADGVFEREVMATKNRLRIRYAHQCSFWGDISIILQTLFQLATYDARQALAARQGKDRTRAAQNRPLPAQAAEKRKPHKPPTDPHLMPV